MVWLKRLGMTAAAVVLTLLCVVAGLFFFKAHESRMMDIPGMEQGRLQPCPVTPNCISSETGESDSHATAALKVTASRHQTPMERIKTVIVGLGGSIIKADENYISATFSSSVFRFTDDLEIRRDQSLGVYHIRSASRVGHSDMDVNRNRVEDLKARLQVK